MPFTVFFSRTNRTAGFLVIPTGGNNISRVQVFCNWIVSLASKQPYNLDVASEITNCAALYWEEIIANQPTHKQP